MSLLFLYFFPSPPPAIATNSDPTLHSHSFLSFHSILFRPSYLIRHVLSLARRETSLVLTVVPSQLRLRCPACTATSRPLNALCARAPGQHACCSDVSALASCISLTIYSPLFSSAQRAVCSRTRTIHACPNSFAPRSPLSKESHRVGPLTVVSSVLSTTVVITPSPSRATSLSSSFSPIWIRSLHPSRRLAAPSPCPHHHPAWIRTPSSLR
jgi:hypothetical protein